MNGAVEDRGLAQGQVPGRVRAPVWRPSPPERDPGFRSPLNGLLDEMSAFGITIHEETVCLFENGLDKRAALLRLTESIAASGAIRGLDAFQQAVFERESIMSTGIGSGIAIPHVRADEVLRATIGVGISHEGIEYGTLDNEPVHIIVLFAMPSAAQRDYLGLLAQVMLSLRTPQLAERLVGCTSAKEVVDLLNAD